MLYLLKKVFHKSALALCLAVSLAMNGIPVWASDTATKLYSADNRLSPKAIAALEESVVLIDTYDKEGKQMAQGSGFAAAKGLFLTNYHVIEGASKYTITDSKGNIHDVQGVVKSNGDFDLALLKTKEATAIKPLTIGSKANVEKADRVIVIGSPQGLQNTVSEGIVSGLRQFQYGEKDNVDIIQITAPISHGSSGGALFDINGHVIGVTTAMSYDSSLKFAVAVDHAKAWLKELAAKPFASIAVLDMSKHTAAYPDNSDENIKSVIYKTFRALEEENIEAYMSLVHKFSPGYKNIREEFKKMFLSMDIDLDILEVDILDKSYDTALVDVIYTIKDSDTPQQHEIYRVFGQYSLSRENGAWKIYQAAETMEAYESDAIYNTGIGGFSKEEAEWAYDNREGSMEASAGINGTSLNFRVADSIMHPTEPVIYATDMSGKKLYSYNYETKETKEASFTLPPESIAFAEKEIYVALLKGNHSPYWYDDDQKGAVAILDSKTLQIKEQLNIDVDPFDIIAKDGYIFVTSGSGQHTRFKSYSRKTLQEVSMSSSGDRSFAELHPQKDIIYTTGSYLSNTVVIYRIADGKFTDPEYPGGISLTDYYYKVGGRFKFTPDGKYMLSSKGSIFNTSGGGLGHLGTLSKEFTDIAFDLDNKRFFTGVKGSQIYEYAYPSFKPAETYKVQGEIIRLYSRDNKLLAITEVNGKCYIETISLKV